jgi:hypothetical protein
MLGRTVIGLVVIVALAWTVAFARTARARFNLVEACGDSAVVAWEPTAPTRGALFRVRVSGVSGSSTLTGTVAGEALHFMRDSAGAASLAAVPIDGGDSINVVVRCMATDTHDSLTARVATASGEYPIERLRVAPAFGRPPDPATAARIAAESRRALDVATGAHGTPRLWQEPFQVPRQSRITSGFGGGREYNGTITSRHMGTDYAGTTGAPVAAANRGVVRIVDGFFYGGNVVYIDHGSGLSSAYLHLSQQLVAVGDTVERGQTVGRVGATGRVTGPHLHFIVRYGSVTVDPLSLFAVAGDSSGAR